MSESYSNQTLSLFNSLPNSAVIVLFGSRAKGNFREGSDIDLAIKNAEVSDTFRFQDEDAATLAGSHAGKSSKLLTELGKKNPKVVCPLIGENLFHGSEFGRIFLMEALLEMKADSAPAYPYVKEISSVETEPGGLTSRYRRWLKIEGIKPVEIPLDVKVAALQFAAENSFPEKTDKEEELIKLGKDKGPELEKLLKPLIASENKEVSSSAKKILDKLKK